MNKKTSLKITKKTEIFTVLRDKKEDEKSTVFNPENDKN